MSVIRDRGPGTWGQCWMCRQCGGIASQRCEADMQLQCCDGVAVSGRRSIGSYVTLVRPVGICRVGGREEMLRCVSVGVFLGARVDLLV
jgi:hypothetical protein